MSIKLDWDVSEAPHDHDVSPSNPANNPIRTEHAQGHGSNTSQPAQLVRSGRRRWLGWLAGLAILAAAAGGGLWDYVQAGWPHISNDRLAAVTHGAQKALQGATNPA